MKPRACWILLMFLFTTTASARRKSAVRQLDRLISAAVQRANLAPRSGGWRSRLRWSALLPRLSVKVRRADSWGEVLDLAADRPALLDTNSYQRTGIELRASWDLARLLFDPRELAVARTGAARSTARQKLIERIIALYYQRELLLRTPPDGGARARLSRVVSIHQLTATLEALTGTALGRQTHRTESKSR